MAGGCTSASKGPSIGLAQLNLLPVHAAVHGAESQRLPDRCRCGLDAATGWAPAFSLEGSCPDQIQDG